MDCTCTIIEISPTEWDINISGEPPISVSIDAEPIELLVDRPTSILVEVENAIFLDIDVGIQGPAGPPGQDSTGASRIEYSFQWNNVTSIIIGTVPANSFVLTATAYITEEFDAPGSYIKVGTLTDPALFLPDYVTDLLNEGIYGQPLGIPVLGNTQVLLTLFATPGNTQGAGTLVLTF